MEFSYKDGETHPKKGKNKEEIESNIWVKRSIRLWLSMS